MKQHALYRFSTSETLKAKVLYLHTETVEVLYNQKGPRNNIRMEERVETYIWFLLRCRLSVNKKSKLTKKQSR